MRFKINIKLRKCNRCGHFECTHCRTICDDGRCLFYDETNPEHVFPPGTQPCDGPCTYDRPIDAEGYGRFDEKMNELRKLDPEGEKSLGDTTEENGTVFIEFDEPISTAT